MNIHEAAAELNGRQYRDECSNDLHRRMKAAGIVAVFGGSDDLVYFAGAANDELGASDGSEYFFTREGLLENKCCDDCAYFEKIERLATPVRAKWSDGGFSWRYETTIPHEKFVIMEDDDTYCEGIVFSLKDVPVASDPSGSVSGRVAEILAPMKDSLLDGIEDRVRALFAEHLPDCADESAVRAAALAFDLERRRSIRAVEAEEEMKGHPPRDVLDAMIAIGPIGNARAAVQATKKSILKRIQSGEFPIA
jgi:hypothetical protein